MCDWRLSYTAPDENGKEQRVRIECGDTNLGSGTCYRHAKVRDGLQDPETDPWMKDVRVKVGKRLIWDGGRVGTPLAAVGEVA